VFAEKVRSASILRFLDNKIIIEHLR